MDPIELIPVFLIIPTLLAILIAQQFMRRDKTALRGLLVGSGIVAAFPILVEIALLIQIDSEWAAFFRAALYGSALIDSIAFSTIAVVLEQHYRLSKISLLLFLCGMALTPVAIIAFSQIRLLLFNNTVNTYVAEIGGMTYGILAVSLVALIFLLTVMVIAIKRSSKNSKLPLH